MLIHYYYPVYHVVKEFIPDVDQRKVLDFGCNYGIFLDTADSSFPLENYTGIDICQDAIEMGRKLFPSANFIHYDGFNPEYNSGGKEQLPKLTEKYDLIVIGSVFTHTSKEQMLSIIDTLYDYLTDTGKIIISWTGYGKKQIAQSAINFLRFFPEHESMDYCYAVQYRENGKTKTKLTQEFPTEDVISLWTFYNIEYFEKLLDKYSTTIIISNDWKQDQVIITRD